MSTYEHHSRLDPLRSFILDLLYPAVVGSMIVLLFLRVANFKFISLTEPTTYFGIIIASYYALGFVNAKMIEHYNVKLAVLDSISSILIFVCFYILGFAQDQIPGVNSPPTNYILFYITLIAVLLTPLFRRLGRGQTRVLTIRSLMAFASILLVALAILNAYGVGYLSWLTPSVVIAALGAVFAAYLIDLSIRGVS